MEKSCDRLTRTKANNAAEAPYPLHAGHDGELNDLERMRYPAVVLSGPAVYIGLCVRVCDCVRMCACACGQMFSDIHTSAWPHFLATHLCAVLPLPLSVLGFGSVPMPLASLHKKKKKSPMMPLHHSVIVIPQCATHCTSPLGPADQ